MRSAPPGEQTHDAALLRCETTLAEATLFSQHDGGFGRALVARVCVLPSDACEPGRLRRRLGHGFVLAPAYFRTAVNAEKQISPTRAGSQRLTEGVLSLLFHPCPSAAPPRPRCSPTAASGATRSRTPSSCNQSQIVVGRDVGFYSGWVNAGFPTILQRIYPHTKY